MGQNDRERKGRIVHRWLGIAAVGFFFLSIGTGLLWANACFPGCRQRGTALAYF